MKRNLLLSIIFVLISITFFGCKKHTSNVIRGKWEMIMVDTSSGGHNFGHRYLISQVWDFRDFKYVFIQSTLSGQAYAAPGVSLDPYPIETEERRRYEVVTRKELNIIHEGTVSYTENYEINKINNESLVLTRFENGKNAGVVELMRVSK